MTRERVVPCCRKDGSTLMSTEVAVYMMYVFSQDWEGALGGLPHTSHTRLRAPPRCVAGRGLVEGGGAGTPGRNRPSRPHAAAPQP